MEIQPFLTFNHSAISNEVSCLGKTDPDEQMCSALIHLW